MSGARSLRGSTGTRGTYLLDVGIVLCAMASSGFCITAALWTMSQAVKGFVEETSPGSPGPMEGWNATCSVGHSCPYRWIAQIRFTITSTKLNLENKLGDFCVVDRQGM